MRITISLTTDHLEIKRLTKRMDQTLLAMNLLTTTLFEIKTLL